MNQQFEEYKENKRPLAEQVKKILNIYMNQCKAKLFEFSAENGILAVPSAAAVPLKLLLFYFLIGVSSNFILVWLITCTLTYLLFRSFRNQWIPAIIYLVLSILMFADVTYSSFFNRYLSVNMLGAAGFLGDITASIKEVLRPAFFLILLDSLMIITILVAKKRGFWQLKREPKEPQSEITLEETTIDLPATETKEKRSDTKKRIIKWMNIHKNPLIAVLIIFLLTFNVSGSFMITSISNQEIYNYHLKDIVGAVTGKGTAGSDYMYTFTDSYRTEKNGPLFGTAAGRNLIVIQMESLENFVINATYNGQEITPNLNQLLKENTIYFDNYYQQVGSGNTSDAEFASNNSIYGTLASYTYKLFDGNYFKGLPVLLKEKGYETAVYHAHENRQFWNRESAYKSLGFDTYYGGIGGSDIDQYDMTEWMGWGLTDTEFFKQTMEFLKKMPQPFYSFIITLSNHHPYLMLDKYQFIDLKKEDKGTIFGNYLNSAAYTDYAIGQLIQQLKEEGLYDSSIIALYGDHLGLPKSDEEIEKSVSRFLGREYDFDTMMNIPLIISVPGAEQDIRQTVSISGGQLDFLPTIAYLMGFDQLDTVYLGHNLLTIDSGFVAEQTYMTKGSFFQDDIVYEMSRDGVFENGRAWNKRTGKSVPIKECYDGYMRSMGLINTSEYILKNDVLRRIYIDNQDAVSAFSEAAAAVYPDEITEAGTPDLNLMGTNSLEALNASYDAGYRNLKIQICWTEDKEAVMLKSWKELSNYFDTEKTSEITLDQFHNLAMKNGLSSMDFYDLVAWVKDHPDVTIVAQVERSSDFFMKNLEGYAGNVLSQFIVEVPGMVEYSGLYHSILNVDEGGNSVDQILDYIELNKVNAITMSSKSAAGKYAKLLKADCISYIEEEDSGLLIKKN